MNLNTKYKLAISDTMVVAIKGTLSENGKPMPFKFSLICDRLGAQELKEMLTQSDELLLKDFVSERTKGWKDQKLVLEQDDTPAEFSSDALDALLDIPGMALMCFNAYVSESNAKQKNS